MIPDETLRRWGANLRKQRENHGLDQLALGKKLRPEVVQTTVSRWERGLVEPSRAYKEQLAFVLHTDADLLFPLSRRDPNSEPTSRHLAVTE